MKMSNSKIVLTVNNDKYEVVVRPWDTLAYTLREVLGFTGVKAGCDRGECGACTVILGRLLVCSCQVLTIECDNQEVTTIEGLGNEIKGELHSIQKAFLEEHGFQCGFCAPAMILCAKHLLDHNPSPTLEEIKDAISGVLCRCTGYTPQINAILKAANNTGGLHR